MNKIELTNRIMTEEDYIRCPKFGNSLSKFINKNADGVKDEIIARLLLIEEEEVMRLYNEAIVMLRSVIQD